MNFFAIPIITLCCYAIGEIFKIIFAKRKETYKIIPVLVSICGGLIGVAIYFTNPEILLNVSNVWTALGIGIVSGSSSTGTNQILKQLLKRYNK